jgi:outer membrane biosynthesis protein TonB
MEPEQKRELPRSITASTPDVIASNKPREQPLPADDLSTRLHLLAKLRQPEAPIPPRQRQQAGSGSSNLTAASADAVPGHDATLGVKDFIRAQVERRWNLNGQAAKGRDWSAGIHIVLSRDGSVTRAEIVDNSRNRSDQAYQEFARSARNAVLLSSPLTVPPGAYDIAKDIVIDFRAKQVSQ